MSQDRINLNEEKPYKDAYKNGFRVYENLMRIKELNNKFLVLPPVFGSPESCQYRDAVKGIGSLKEKDVSDLTTYLATEEIELHLNDGFTKDLSDKILELIEDEEAKDRLRNELPR